jgi:hypothetical protein
MKWCKKEIKFSIKLLKEGKTYDEISEITGRGNNAIRNKLGKMGETLSKYKFKESKICIKCGNEIKNKGEKFCSRSCSATYNNKLRLKSLNECLGCGNLVLNKFCDNTCQQNYNRKIIFEKIEEGDTTLFVGQYRKYLIYKNGKKCMGCGWREVNPHSGKVPIELEHIDGNSSNNSLDNLKLLCPNCHSLTPTYKALNSGNGRYSRRERYKGGKSY